MTEEAGGNPPGRRSYPKGARRRRQILGSAITLFAQRGTHEALTVENAPTADEPEARR